MGIRQADVPAVDVQPASIVGGSLVSPKGDIGQGGVPAGDVHPAPIVLGTIIGDHQVPQGGTAFGNGYPTAMHGHITIGMAVLDGKTIQHRS